MTTVKPVVVAESLEARKASRLSVLGFFMALPPMLLVICFVGAPILIAFTFSLGWTTGPNRVVSIIGQEIHKKDQWWGTFGAYKDVFHDSRFPGDLRTTLLVTLISTTLVLTMALGIGIYQRMIGGRIASIMTILTLVPLFVPVVIASWAIHTFYAGDGFMRTLMSHFGIDFPTLTSTSTAIAIGTIWTSLPFAILMVTSGLQSVPDALIETAQDAGAGFFRIIRTVLIPLALTPIVIAGTFTAIGIMGSFTIPLFLGPNQPTMLGVEISNFFGSYNRPQQSIVMAFIVFAAASGIAFIYIWANVRSAKQSGRI
ncbi:MAG: ABC transporter permease subunit [Actinobacteria bacterium]|nr:ABC transporter permease subunit [Actinomycetota bacterium]